MMTTCEFLLRKNVQEKEKQYELINPFILH